MKKLVSITIAFMLIYSSGFSQENLSGEEIFRDAEFFFSTGEYEEALYLFLQLTRDYPDNFNFQFRVGMSYLNVDGRETKAIPYLERAVKNTTLKYKEKDFRTNKAPHHAWFYLGNAYRINNELDMALESYNKFMDIRNFEKEYNLRIVENEMQSCQRAKIIKDSPLQIAKYNLGTEINSTSHNFQPVVNQDESVIVFMQRLRFYDAMMFSSKHNGEWTTPINITPQVGSDGDMIPTGISTDGKEMLLVKTSVFGNKDIYYSRLENNFWSKAVDLGKNINSGKNEDHASFSSDGGSIVFSSDRRGGFGKLDLYEIKRFPDNTLGEPINLGPVINSAENETSAFLVMNSRHLYFASEGHFNMGGYDIFFAEKTDEGWTDPVNPGYPLNTTADNRFYQPVKDGNTGYMPLFNLKENFQEEDIYRIEMAPLAKINLPERSMLNKSFRLELKDPETGKKIVIRYDKDKDQFISTPANGGNYEIKFSETREP